MAKTITTMEGSTDFPVNNNDKLVLVETIANQNIRGVKSANSMDDAFYDYDVNEGKVIEEAVIKMASGQAYNKDAFDRAAKDPEILVKYFNNWESKQYQTTVRKDDIRAILTKGNAEAVASEVIDTLTQGEDDEDFEKKRDTLYKAAFKDYSLILKGKPKNMKGVIYCARDMFNHLKCNNSDLTDVAYKSSTPVSDIRIALSSKMMNAIDVVELANIFNLSKEEMLGKLVIIDVDDLSDHSKDGIIYAYDRKALGRATRLYEVESERIVKGRYDNFYLTAERMYFHNGLFKGAKLDCTEALTAALAEIITPNAMH